MNYAKIENGIVVNIIWLYPTTEFNNAVPCNDIPVKIGDTYINGKFYREGVLLVSQIEDMRNALEILGVSP